MIWHTPVEPPGCVELQRYLPISKYRFFYG